jgi:hypothetical protein
VFSFFAIIYEYGVEQTFPSIGEATTQGFINSTSNIISVVEILVLTKILEQ